MKNIISFFLFSIFLSAFFSCSDGITTNDPVDNNQTSLQKITLEIECTCANNQYPPIGYETCLGMEWCDIPNNIVSYPRETICIFWSNLVSSPTGRIYKIYDCSGPGISYSRPKATTCGFHLLSYPDNGLVLTWEFVWCDYYILQKKVGSGGWFDIFTSRNDNGNGSKRFVDYNYVSPEPISYRVITQIGDKKSYSNVIFE